MGWLRPPYPHMEKGCFVQFTDSNVNLTGKIQMLISLERLHSHIQTQCFANYLGTDDPVKFNT